MSFGDLLPPCLCFLGWDFQAVVKTENEEALKDAVCISQNSSHYIKMGAFYNL